MMFGLHIIYTESDTMHAGRRHVYQQVDSAAGRRATVAYMRSENWERGLRWAGHEAPNSPDLNAANYDIWVQAGASLYHGSKFDIVYQLKQAIVLELRALRRHFTDHSIDDGRRLL